MNGKYWERFPHGAQSGVRGIGATEEEAFEQAAHALTSVITDPVKVQHLEPVKIACAGATDAEMFAEWVSALVRQMDERRMLFGHFDVYIHDGRLRATAWGEELDENRHRPARRVRGPVADALVRQDETGTWLAQCLVGVEAASAANA
jgi:SHS2 domain-containing protein